MSAEITGVRHSHVHTVKIHSESGKLVEITNMSLTPMGVLDVTIKILGEDTSDPIDETK